MKKIFSILLAIAVMATMVACGTENKAAAVPAAAPETVPAAVSEGTPDTAAEPVKETEEPAEEPEETGPVSILPEGCDPDKLYMTAEKSVVTKVKDAVFGTRYDHRVADVITEYTYDSLGELSGEEKHLEHVITAESDLMQYNYAIQDPEFYGIQFEYYPDGSVKSADVFEPYNEYHVIYEMNQDGSLKSTKADSHNSSGTPTYVQSDYSETGLLIREHIYFRTGESCTDMTYEYDNDGRCVKETQLDYERRAFSGNYIITVAVEKPYTKVYEYTANGYIKYYSFTGEDGILYEEERYEYDENDNCLKACYLVGDNPREIEMTYNGNGFETTAKVTYPDGAVKQYTFEYDDQDFLTAYNENSGDDELRTEYTYDDQGYLSKLETFKNGKSSGKCTYKTQDNGYGSLVLVCKGKSPLGLDGKTVAEEDGYHNGNVSRHYEYKLIAHEDSVGYENTHNYFYSYGEIPYFVEADTEGLKTISADDVYPVLPDTVEGYPLPEQDGSEHLSNITVEFTNALLIPVEYHTVFDGYGNIAGALVSFKSNAYNYSEKNEYGFPIKRYPYGQEQPEYYILYTYSDDMRSYTSEWHEPGSDVISESFNLEEFSLKDAFNDRCESSSGENYVEEFNEYGLMTRSSYKDYYDDRYTYKYTPDENGCLKTVEYASDDGYIVPRPVWAFDDHGYMTVYTMYTNNYNKIIVDYTY